LNSVASGALLPATATRFAIIVSFGCSYMSLRVPHPDRAGLLLEPMMLGTTLSTDVAGRHRNAQRYKRFPVAGLALMNVARGTGGRDQRSLADNESAWVSRASALVSGWSAKSSSSLHRPPPTPLIMPSRRLRRAHQRWRPAPAEAKPAARTEIPARRAHDR